MENGRVNVKFKRGTVAVGALAIIAIFMIAVSCLTVIVMEYSRFAYSVKAANEAVVMKGEEELKVQALRSSGTTDITVTNEGSTSSLVFGVYAVNPTDNNPTYYKLSQPTIIRILGDATFSIPHPISDNWRIGVLTSLGNVFWESQAISPPPPPKPWLTGWAYRKSHIILPASGAGANYQVRIKIYYGSGTDSGENAYLSGCRADFGDVRFTGSDEQTESSYWMQEKVDSSYAIFWVNIDADLSFNPATIYVYYGNPSATTTSNGDKTFQFFDDFNDNSLDANKWETQTNSYVLVSETSQQLRIYVSSSGAGVWYEGYVRSKPAFGTKYAIMCRQYWYRESGPNVNFRSGWGDSTDAVGGSNFVYQNSYGLWTNPETHSFYSQKSGVGTYSVDTGSIKNAWRTIEYRRDDDRAEELWDGVSKGSTIDTNNIPTNNLRVGMWARRGANWGNAYIYMDWVAVRRYVDPEPSHGSWSDAES